MPKRAAPKRGQPRQKTHGRLVRTDGPAENLVSGESGADYDLACERAWDVGVAPRPWKFDRASHVELKLASRMHHDWKRDQAPRHETLVINNRPCDKNEFDCEYVIDRFLPPGSTLTVYGPAGFKKVYRGRDSGQ